VQADACGPTVHEMPMKIASTKNDKSVNVDGRPDIANGPSVLATTAISN